QIFVGIDVQSARGCAVAWIGKSGRALGSRWVDAPTPEALAKAVHQELEDLQGEGVAIGIDSPRRPLSDRRRWYWERRGRRWRMRRHSEAGHGRHCEVVIAAHGLATPQWTCAARRAPHWMKRGFALFRRLEPIGQVYEVF